MKADQQPYLRLSSDKVTLTGNYCSMKILGLACSRLFGKSGIYPHSKRWITVFADYDEWLLTRSRSIYAEQRQNLLDPLGHSRHRHERQEDLQYPKFH